MLKHLYRWRPHARDFGRDVATTQLASLAAYSMSTPEVLRKHFDLGRDIVTRSVIGDFVECGVCDGGSAAVIANAMRETSRHAWLYDSFEGLPEPAPVDGPAAPGYHGACVGSEQAVRAALRIAGIEERDYTIRKGWFADTFQLPLPGAVSFLHIDADWYDSVLAALTTFYDRVSIGGIVLLDDFGHWEGCREAFYDFINQKNIKPLLERFGHSQAFWVKGREHNRGE